MKMTDKFRLYAWKNKNAPYKMNVGKKVCGKEDYISSIESSEFWGAYGRGELDQYCIFESDDAEVISAAEWCALHYGMSIYGKEHFYNRFNNAHKGDQSLVTTEIKQKIMDFYENRLSPESETENTVSRGKNIINKVESGGYPVVNIPIHELIQLSRKQARSVHCNVHGTDQISKAYYEDPKKFEKNLTPGTAVRRKSGELQILDGTTRTVAGSNCKGLNTLPFCIVPEEDFGETEQEIETNILIAGSYANRRSPVYTCENDDDDLEFQMEKFIELQNWDLSNITLRPSYRDNLTSEFAESAGSRGKASGIVTRVFNKFDDKVIVNAITKNMRTYPDSELKAYRIQKYETKGIPAVVAEFSKLSNFQALGYIFHHVRDMSKTTDKLAIILHARSKKEWAKEQENNKIGELREIIRLWNLPVIVDVLPSFDEE